MNNKIVAVDCRIYESSLKTLSEMGYTAIKIQKNIMLDEPVSAHPDMSLTIIDDILFVDASVDNLFTFFNKVHLLNREANENSGSLKYPDDIEFNCVQVGNNLICNKKFTHSDIIKFAHDRSINILNVKQGYAKCSVCVVSDNAIITEDDGITATASVCGIDVLKISKGFVRLDGYDYGFFGGCCGLLEKDLLAFNGNIKKHPDYQSISKFCNKYGINIVSLSDEPLYDVGTIYRIL